MHDVEVTGEGKIYCHECVVSEFADIISTWSFTGLQNIVRKARGLDMGMCFGAMKVLGNRDVRAA